MDSRLLLCGQKALYAQVNRRVVKLEEMLVAQGEIVVASQDRILELKALVQTQRERISSQDAKSFEQDKRLTHLAHLVDALSPNSDRCGSCSGCLPKVEQGSGERSEICESEHTTSDNVVDPAQVIVNPTPVKEPPGVAVVKAQLVCASSDKGWESGSAPDPKPPPALAESEIGDGAAALPQFGDFIPPSAQVPAAPIQMDPADPPSDGWADEQPGPGAQAPDGLAGPADKWVAVRAIASADGAATQEVVANFTREFCTRDHVETLIKVLQASLPLDAKYSIPGLQRLLSSL